MIKLLNTTESNYLSEILKHTDLACFADLIYRMITAPETDENALAIKKVNYYYFFSKLSNLQFQWLITRNFADVLISLLGENMDKCQCMQANKFDEHCVGFFIFHKFGP